MVKLLSVALMNEPGTFAHVATSLGKAGINIEAWMGDAQAEIGVARLLVDDPDRALEVLRGAGHPVQLIRAVKVPMENEPGRLADALQALGRAKINIILAFGSTGEAERGEAVFVVAEDDIGAAMEVLGAT